MGRISLHIGGMDCRRCVREVTARMRDVPGVETVAVVRERSLVHLSGGMKVAEVLEALDGTRYRPQVIPREQR